MSKIVRKINKFFQTAIKKDVLYIKDELILTERQNKIFDLFYIQKKQIDFIADEFCVCPQVIHKELKNIRNKIIQIIE